MTEIPPEVLRAIERALEAMKGTSGSVTWHFKDGRILKVEKRTIEDVK